MLEDHATDNDITIAAHGFTHRQLDDEDWLTETDHLNLGGGQYDVKLFTA